MNLYFRELRARWRSLLVWAIVILFLIASGMSEFQAFAETGDELNRIFRSLPPGLLKVMGLDPSQDLTSLTVYFSVYYLYFALILDAHAILLGASLLIREESEKTADFLLTRPWSRSRIVTAKIAAAKTQLILLNLFIWLVSFAFIERFRESDQALTVPLLAMCLSLLIQQLVFFAAGLFLSAVAPRQGIASSLAGGVLLAAFLVKVLADLSEDLEWLGYLSPLRWFDGLKVLTGSEDAWNPAILAGAAVFVLLFLGLAYFIYRRRDLAA